MKKTTVLSLFAGVVLIVAAVPVAAQLVPEALYYKFNEGTGATTANHAIPGQGSPSANIVGTAAWETTSTAIGAGAIKLGTAATNDAYVDTGWQVNTPSTQSWTIEFWLRPASNASQGQYPFTAGTSGQFRCWLNGAGTGALQFITGSTTTPGLLTHAGATGLIPPNVWTHVAWVYDAPASATRLYINGTLDSTVNGQNASFTLSAAQTLKIGYYTSNSWGGDVDEFRFWMQARTQADIAAWMNVEVDIQGDAVLLGNQSQAQDLITGPQTDLVMVDMTAAAINTSQTLNAITFTKSGTVPNASVGTIKLVHDVNNDGVFDVGDTVLGQGALTGNTITFNSGAGFPIPVPTTGGPRLLLAVSSAAPWAIGDTIEFSVATSADVTWSGGTDYTSYPVSSGVRAITPPFIQLGNPASTSTNTIPFNSSAYRMMTVYSASELAAVAAGSLITEIQLHGTAATPGPTYTDFELRLAHSTSVPTALSNTWADNFIGNQTTVISAAQFTPVQLPGSPTPSLWVFKFETPFVYNGTDGICVDFQFSGRNNTGFSLRGDTTRQRTYSTNTIESPTATTVTTTMGNFGIDFYFDPTPGNQNWIANRNVQPILFDHEPTDDAVVLSLEAGTHGASQNISSMTFNKTGTVPDGSISNVKLVHDVNENGKVDAGDTVLGSGTLTGGSVTFAMAASVPSGAPVRLLLAISSTAALTNGNTIGFELASAASVTWSGGADVTAYPVVSPPAIVTVPMVSIGTALPATNAIPFGGTGTTTTLYTRHLTLYSAEELSHIPAGALIEEIRIHSQDSASVPPIYTDFELRIAHSDTHPFGMSSTWDANWVGAQTTVIASASYSPTALPGTQAPNQWRFQFTSPFIYNGVQGIAVEFHMTARTGNFGTASAIGRQRVYTTATTNPATGTLSSGTGNAAIDFVFNTTPAGVALVNQTTGTGIGRNPNDFVMLDLIANSYDTARDLNSLTLTKFGTVPDSSISSVKLVLDVDDNGEVSPGDTVLASGVLTAGATTLNITPALNVPVSPSPRLLVAITSSAPLAFGDTIGLEITSASDVTWSGSPTDFAGYPVSSGLRTVALLGIITIAQTGPADYSDIGDAFDALEQFGIGGPVVLQIMDSATYVSTPSYSLGYDHTTTAAMQARVQGASATNTITLRPAPGQKPVIQGNANGAMLAGTTSSSITPLTGRGALAIMESYVIIEGLRVTGGPNFGIFIQANNGTFAAPNGFTPVGNVIRRCIVWDIPDGPGIAFMGQNAGYYTGTIENNFVWNCFTNSVPATSVLQGINTNAGCIAIRNPQNGQGIVRHNTILNTAAFANVGGIGVGSASTAFALHDCNNNIIVCTNPIAPAYQAQATTHLPSTANCNFNYWFATVQSNQVTVNTFALWQAAGLDPNGFDADPLLDDITGPIPDLRLSATSPAINPVGNTSTLADDIFGLSRPVGATNDIGAYEWRQTPEIRVLQGATAVPNGGNYDVGVVSATPGTPVTFTISNPGQLDLSLTGTPAVGITLGSNMAATTVVQTQPASTTLLPAGTTTFVVMLNPIASGTFDCTITIANNTLTRNPYVFTITGAVNTAPAIAVSTTAGSVTNAGNVNVAYASALSALGLQISVSDLDGGNVSLAATIGNGTTQGFVLSEWESASATVPYNRTPTTGSFSVPSVSHLVTLTANDGIAQTVFTFTLVVGPSTPPTISIPTAGSIFVGSAAAGYSATVAPGSLPANAVLELADVDNDSIDVTAVAVAPSAPAGISAPGTSVGNPAGTPISFTGDASLTVPGTYTWTITITDGLTAPVNVDVSITVQDLPANHVAGAQAGSGDGSAANPYAGSVGLGGTPSLELATVTDPNTTQTLTLVNVTPGGSNPSGIFNVGFLGVGNAGTIEAVATGTVTVTDVGVHDFTVSISDGTNIVDIAVRITVTNTGNVPPMAGLAAGSAFAGTQAAGFTLTVNPGQTLANANLTVSDTDGNEITVVSVSVAPSALSGVTAPTAAAAAPGPFNLSWTGTADASVTPGAFIYTVTLSDGITTPVSFNVTITLADLPPEFTAGANVSQGDGTAANPFAVSTRAGKTPTFEMAVVTDPNTGQTVTLANVAADPGNPTSGAGFTVTLSGGTLFLTANGKLSDGGSGTYRFTATVTDGTNSVPIALQVRVAKAPKDDSDGGCSTTSRSSWWLAALLAAVALPLLRRRKISA